MATENKKYFFINSLAKGLEVLELLSAKGELSVSEVAKSLGQNRTGSHRILATLKELGYVEQSQDNRYHMTFKFLEMGMKLSNRLGIKRVALPYMQELSMAFGETINLGILDRFCVLHLEKIDSTEILRMDSQIGSRAPVHCSALGKAMLAFLPEDERNRMLSQLELTPMGPNCITVQKELEQEIKTIQHQGFAFDDEELVAGLRCVAAPVFDHTGLARYAISVSGPAMRMTNERMDSAKKHVINICKKLSMQLKNLEI